jgi:hypothetical protein
MYIKPEFIFTFCSVTIVVAHDQVYDALWAGKTPVNRPSPNEHIISEGAIRLRPG